MYLTSNEALASLTAVWKEPLERDTEDGKGILDKMRLPFNILLPQNKPTFMSMWLVTEWFRYF